MNIYITKKIFRSAVLILTATLVLALNDFGQSAGTGSIQGTVADTTGAVITNATVTITDIRTQVKHTVITSQSGLYSFPNLNIGTYTVAVEAKGFQHYAQSNVVLEVGSSIAVNVVMQVGGSEQKIEVQASGLALQTEDTSFKQTIDQKTVTELPLNGRQVTSLITLSGGSVNANAGSDLQGSKSFYSSVVVSVAGGQGSGTEYKLDGGDHNDYMTNINLPFPFPDAVAQFSVESTALGAQSGLHPGGLVNVVTRSGANQFHGAAFEFIRNNYIDATNFFSTSKDTLHQNQFGGTFGGRVIRDKLFLFAGYQRTVANQSQALTKSYVPTAANLLGDFSVTDGPGCIANGKAVQLLNPQTGEVLPNNHIDPSTFVSSALALEKYLPPTTDPCGAVTYAIPSQVRENQFVTRGDWTISSKHTLSGRYLLDGYQAPAFYSPSNVLLTTQAGNTERVQGITLSETYLITSKMVNAFNATATRRLVNRGPAAPGINPASIGINIYTPAAIGLGLTVTNKFATYCGTCVPITIVPNAYSFGDQVDWALGKHQISFGGSFTRVQFNSNGNYEENGNYTFSGTYSQKGPAGNSTGGTGADANLDFLTGSMNAFAQSKAQQVALRGVVPALYIADTYHVSNKVVLSAGVRWNPEFFPSDYFNRGSVFNYSDFLSNTVSQVYPNAPAGSLYYGDTGVSKSFTKNSPWQFSPRVGMTYDPFGSGKTVFRIGGAFVYDLPGYYTGQRVQQNPPFGLTIANTPVNVPLSFVNPWSNGSQPSNPFPLPFRPTADTQFSNGGQYIVLPPQFHSPYMLQYTASVQQEFGHGWQFQIDYIGNKTSFNPYGLPLNPAVYIPGTCGTTACSTTGNASSRFALTLANPSQGPKYAGGGTGSIQISTGANSSYNGLVVSIQHRLSSSFVFLANYTWSHCIDIEDNPGDISGTTVQNPANIKGDRASCGFDFRDVFNTAIVAGSHFPLSGWKAQAFNNWQISPLFHITDGAPFNVTSGIDNSLTSQGNDRPNLINPAGVYTHNKIYSGPSTNAQYISVSAFSQNDPGTFGNSGRNAYRGPKYLQFDSALSRNFPLHDALTLILRLEAFNVLNHPNFAAPGSTTGFLGSSSAINSATFGQVVSTANNYGARIFQGAVKITF